MDTSVLAPLWNVDQESSREFLGKFYQHLLTGEPMWKALWDAQKSMLESPREPFLTHPYHWAPFTMTGGWL